MKKLSHRDWIFEELKWSIQILAADSENQISHFPGFADVPFELVFDFENYSNAAINTYGDFLNPEQLIILARMRDMINASCPFENNSISEEEELTTDAFWIALRKLAKEVLILFHWTNEIPPKERNTFIQ